MSSNGDKDKPNTKDDQKSLLNPIFHKLPAILHPSLTSPRAIITTLLLFITTTTILYQPTTFLYNDDITPLSPSEEITPLLITTTLATLTVLYYKLQSSSIPPSFLRFATLEFLSSAIGNGLLLLLPVFLSSSYYSPYFARINLTYDGVTQCITWWLFALLYFPTGGHVNSSLTVGVWAAGQIGFWEGLGIVFVQVCGCLVGAEVVRYWAAASAVFGDGDGDGVDAVVGPLIPPYSQDGSEGIYYTAAAAAGGYECICTILMVLLNLACDCFDEYYVIPSTLVVALVRYTGAGMDPLGAASVGWFRGDGWRQYQMEVYWCSSLLGGVIAGWIWRRYGDSVSQFLNSFRLPKDIEGGGGGGGGRRTLWTPKIIRKALIELLTTTVTTILLIPTILLTHHHYQTSSTFSSFLLHSLLFVLLSYIYLPTGAYVNPAVVVGSYAAGRIGSLAEAVVYLAAQVVGFMGGLATVDVLVPPASAPPESTNGLILPVVYLVEEKGGGGSTFGSTFGVSCLVVLVFLGRDYFDSCFTREKRGVQKHYVVSSALVVMLMVYSGGVNRVMIASVNAIVDVSVVWGYPFITALVAGDGYGYCGMEFILASTMGGLVAGIAWRGLIIGDNDGSTTSSGRFRLATTIPSFDRDTLHFALFEIFSTGLGNFILAVTVLLLNHYEITNDNFTRLNLLVCFLLFVLFYFPTGAHANPSLSVGCYIAGQITLGQMVVYIVAQVVGSMVAMEVMRYVTPLGIHGYFAPPVPPYLQVEIMGEETTDGSDGGGSGGTMIQAALYESICTFLMILLCFVADVTFDRHYIVASGIVVVLVRYTGAGMDPLAWSCGSWFAWMDGAEEDGGDGEELWGEKMEVYWGAGMVGGAVAGWVWRVYESRVGGRGGGGDVKEKVE